MNVRIICIYKKVFTKPNFGIDLTSIDINISLLLHPLLVEFAFVFVQNVIVLVKKINMQEKNNYVINQQSKTFLKIIIMKSCGDTEDKRSDSAGKLEDAIIMFCIGRESS